MHKEVDVMIKKDMKKVKITKKKKLIDLKKFVPLAKKVRKYLEEEEEYLKNHENNKTSGFLSAN